jgi:hypothetical protein
MPRIRGDGRDHPDPFATSAYRLECELRRELRVDLEIQNHDQ